MQHGHFPCTRDLHLSNRKRAMHSALFKTAYYHQASHPVQMNGHKKRCTKKANIYSAKVNSISNNAKKNEKTHSPLSPPE